MRATALPGVLALGALVFGSGPAAGGQAAATAAGTAEPHAQAPADAGGDRPAIDLEELKRQVEILAQEVERLRSGEGAPEELSDDDARALGLAPAAASAYRQQRGVSIAGYGELLYENFASENEGGAPTGGGARLDFLRAILYAGYRFDDRFLFNSEIEVEHADEISVEFAYVDFLAHENLGVRAGMLLLPMGLVNEYHEPTVFVGAKRPETESRILPSTWRENGFGIHGSAGRLAYRAYVVNGLRGSRFSADGLRGGRQKGAEALAEDMAFTARLDLTPTPGVLVGASVYAGGADQGEVVEDGRPLDVSTAIFDVHGQVRLRGLDVRALYARARIGNAARLNQALGLTRTSGVAETMEGGYVQVGYDVLSQVSSSGVSLLPYFRYERIDTQASMPAGYARAGSTDRTIRTLGLELKPIPSVVLKADLQLVGDAAGTGRNQFNLSMGYAF